MAQVLIPRGIQINLRGEDDQGNELLHVFGAAVESGPVTYDDCSGVAGIVGNWAITSGGLKELIPTSFSILEVVATARDVVEGPQATLPVFSNGTKTADRLPGNSTLALKKAGIIAARWARGRFYAWPATVDDVTGNRFVGGYVTAAKDAYNHLLTAMEGGGWPMVILSNSHAQIALVSVITTVDDNVDSQRRRLNGRGA